jgi:hypothetical protein
MDPKMLDQTIRYKLNEKCDIYSLGVLFWELTTYLLSSNGFEDIILGEPVPNTNETFTELYQSKCKINFGAVISLVPGRFLFLFFCCNLNFNLFE